MRTDLISATPDTLLRQAPMTAREYFAAAHRDLDELFGDGYAKSRPDLVTAYVQACSADFTSAMLVKAIDRVAAAIEFHAET